MIGHIKTGGGQMSLATDVLYGHKPDDLVVENRIETDDEGNIELITSLYYVEGGQYYVHEPVEVKVIFDDLVVDYCKNENIKYPREYVQSLYDVASSLEEGAEKCRNAAYKPEMAMMDYVDIIDLEPDEEFLDATDYRNLLGLDIREK